MKKLCSSGWEILFMFPFMAALAVIHWKAFQAPPPWKIGPYGPMGIALGPMYLLFFTYLIILGVLLVKAKLQRRQVRHRVLVTPFVMVLLGAAVTVSVEHQVAVCRIWDYGIWMQTGNPDMTNYTKACHAWHRERLKNLKP